MTRRDSVLALLGSALPLTAAPPERSQQKLREMFGSAQGVALLLDVAANRLIASHRLEVAAQLVVPPGSTLKPLTLTALLESGKLQPTQTHACGGNLMLAGRSFACVHPRTTTPVDLPLAIAYSCNEFVAHAAQGFAPGELAAALNRTGLASRTQLAGRAEAIGSIQAATTTEATQLQALGEDRIQVTPLELAAAYRGLALKLADPKSKLLPVRDGMEAAVEIGTAQRAAVPGVKVAGKTGSSLQRSALPTRWAWFAGFAPSRNPEVVVVVLTQGSAGGADSAPIASKILRAHFGGEL